VRFLSAVTDEKNLSRAEITESTIRNR